MAAERFRIEKLVERDVDEIAKILVAAISSPRLLLEFKDVSPADFLAFEQATTLGVIRAAEKSGGKCGAFKVVDFEAEPPRIAAVAVWGWELEAVEYIAAERTASPWPAGMNHELRGRFDRELEEMEERYRPGVPYIELLELVTSPDYRRQGLASRLINIGLERADKEQKKCFLSGSPMGVPVYKKRDFKEVGRLSIPLKEWSGGDEVHVHVAMIREPKSVETESEVKQ